MDEVDTTTLASGSETPATQASETAQPSAANNYEGIVDSGKTIPADQQTEEPDLSAETEKGEGTEEAVDLWAGYVDFELDGQVFKVPDALKDGYYRNKDYTQGKQAIAEERKALISKQEEVVKLTQITEQEIDLRVDLTGMASRLTQYEQVDWETLENEDFVRAQSEWRKFQQLKENFNEKRGNLHNLQVERSQIAERDIATRIAETGKFAYENLPGMSQALDNKITDFAIKDLGYNPDTLKKSYTPQIYRTLYLAFLGQQTLNQQQTKAKTPQVKPQTQPLTVVSAKTGSSGRKSLHEMAASGDHEGYRAARIAQMAKAKS